METTTLTQEEVAKLLSTSVRTVQRYVQQGKLKPAYIRGKTHRVPVFQVAEVTALQQQLSRRPVYLQATLSTPLKAFALRVAPEEIGRLQEHAVRCGLSPSELARRFLQYGLQDGSIAKDIATLKGERDAIHRRLTELEQSVREVRKEFRETIEILLEFTGLSPKESREWVRVNLKGR